MAASNFATCLGKVLKHEGGFIDHKRDPGGATNQGAFDMNDTTTNFVAVFAAA